MSYLSEQYEITDEERHRPWGQQPASIVWCQWVRHTKAQTDERLAAAFAEPYTSTGRFNYDYPPFAELANEFTPGNLTTLMLLLGEEAYMRDVLDEEDWLRIQDEG